MRSLIPSAWAVVLLLGCSPSPPPAPPAPAQVEPEAPAAPPTPEPVKAQAAAADAPAEPMLTVLSKPSGASVSYQGRLLGKTPLVIKAPAGGDHLSLTLAYAGLGESSHDVPINDAGHYALNVDLNAASAADSAAAAAPPARAPDADDAPIKAGPFNPPPKELTAQQKMEQRLAAEAAKDREAKVQGCKDKLKTCQHGAGSCLAEPKVEIIGTNTQRMGFGGRKTANRTEPMPRAQWANELVDEVPCQLCWQKFEACSGQE